MEQSKPKKVWIIDPEDVVRAIFQDFCAMAGYDTEQFTNPADALERIKSGERPDGVTCNFLGSCCRMKGSAFFEEAAPYINGSAKLLITGIAGDVKPEDVYTGVKVISKPVSIAKFTRNLAYLMGDKTEGAWVVEDCPEQGSRLVRMLQGDGYTTTHFGCHTEAIGALEEGLAPSVVVSDLANTGKMSVFEFYQHPKLKDASKVIVTGYPVHQLEGGRTKGIKILNRHTLSEGELIDFLNQREVQVKYGKALDN